MTDACVISPEHLKTMLVDRVHESLPQLHTSAMWREINLEIETNGVLVVWPICSDCNGELCCRWNEYLDASNSDYAPGGISLGKETVCTTV